MLSIDGVHLKDDLGLTVHMDSEEEALPSTQDYSVNVPGRHGDYTFKSWLQPRKINVVIVIPRQESTTDLQVFVREVMRLLVDQFGNPKTVELIYDFEPDKYYSAKYSGSVDYDRVANTGRLELPFTAYDPYAYSNTFNDEVTWGSTDVFFTNTTYTYGNAGTGASGVNVTGPTAIDVSVEGYAVKPIIEVEGSAGSLTLKANGHTIEFPSFSDVIWTIDCDKYLVMKDGNNAFGEVRLRDFLLNEGLNEIDVTGTNINVNIKIKFRDKFL